MQIQEKNHFAVLNSSLEKAYNKSKTNGVLENIDLYFLNCIYKLITNSYLTLTSLELNKLISFYNKLLIYNKDLCNLQFITQYRINNVKHFQQADSSDCNELNDFGKIYYWQEDNYLTLNNDILLLLNNINFFNNKQNDTFINFKLGKNIDYLNIGKLCFAIIPSSVNDNYKIYDFLENDITHMFTKSFNTILNCTLYVSDNNYTLSNIKIKIKK